MITVSALNITGTGTVANADDGALARAINTTSIDISGTSAGTRGASASSTNFQAYSAASMGSGAFGAIEVIDFALAQVNTARSRFGAVQNRFDAVIANLQVSLENQSAARSRILDADYAKETAALSRAQVLQQAGTAMLSQANQLPQQVLQLLRG
jgi:flagellin